MAFSRFILDLVLTSSKIHSSAMALIETPSGTGCGGFDHSVPVGYPDRVDETHLSIVVATVASM